MEATFSDAVAVTGHPTESRQYQSFVTRQRCLGFGADPGEPMTQCNKPDSGQGQYKS